jgi:ethanolamine utilization protein EutN
MLIARVIGDLTSTQKHSSHVGQKILVVQPLELDGGPRGNAVIALDSVNAGIGDRVLLVQDGFAAMTAVGRPQSPIDMAVVGVIDSVELLSPGNIEIPSTPAAGVLPPLAPPKKQAKKNRS